MDKLILHLAVYLALIFYSNFSFAQQNSRLANEYYFKGDLEKAEIIFSEILKSEPEKIPEIHSNYLALLMTRSDFPTVRKYMSKVLKSHPTELQYKADMLYVLETEGDMKEKDRFKTEILKRFGKNQYQLSLIAQQLVTRELLDDAVAILIRARRISGNSRTYALDLAAIYRMKDELELMTDEYLNYAMMNPGNTNYIKNVFQHLLTEEEDLDFLEKSLISKVQQRPDQQVYSELLIWVELQRKNFYGAFVQARAMDKRLSKPGDECMRVGQIAMDNDAWEDAEEIFEYVISEFGNGFHYEKARQLKIEASEKLVKSQYPVDKTRIKLLTNEYQTLYNELGPTLIALEAMRNKALLHAFYLDEMSTAIQILDDIIATPRISKKLVSTCKMNLGDIYLLIDEPWEASLLYSQVEKSNKYATTGYAAKLKNARLHYFTGNFAMSKSALGVLKRATTKEISNDAIDLGLLINNNTVFDTTDLVMKKFANVELLTYQHKDSAAKKELQSLISSNQGHSLLDEAYWLLADLNLRAGIFDSSVYYLEKIVLEFPDDILADDAFFNKCEIVEKHLNDLVAAQEMYREFLTKYPGSMYVAEARKRFRYLRGDFIN